MFAAQIVVNVCRVTIAPIVSNVRVVPKKKIALAIMAVTNVLTAEIVLTAKTAPHAQIAPIVSIVTGVEIVGTAPPVNIAMIARTAITVNIV